MDSSEVKEAVKSMDTEEYRKKIEREILQVMKEKLESGEMDAQRAKAIAKMVLQKIKPGITLGEIYRVVPTLDDEFPKLARVVLPVINDYRQRIEGLAQKEYSHTLTPPVCGS